MILICNFLNLNHIHLKKDLQEMPQRGDVQLVVALMGFDPQVNAQIAARLNQVLPKVARIHRRSILELQLGQNESLFLPHQWSIG